MNQHHIITTDDDPAIRKVLELILKKADYKVTKCTNGDELISQLKIDHASVDLVILDIKMPGKSGFEVLEIIHSRYPDLPIIMMTAFSDLETGMKAIREGAADFLSKPVHKAELLDCVERVLTKSKEQKAKSHAFHINSNYQKELETKLDDAYMTIMKTTMATIEALSETIEQKDVYTKGHCSRVRSLSLKIAEYLPLSSDDLLILEAGALLHDIGKIGISEQILNKKSTLTDEEFETIRMHPEAGAKIVQYIDLFKPYLPIIRNHHERYDGTGYPDGLKGEEIPLLVRIVTLTDAFDAMTSNRPYRDALPKLFAVEELKLNRGSQFDPHLVDIFIDHEIYEL